MPTTRRRGRAATLAATLCTLLAATANSALADVVPTACLESDPGAYVSKCARWIARDDTASGYDQAFGVVTNGAVTVALHSGYDASSIVAVGRDAATGALLWRSTYAGAGVQARDIAMTPDGGTVAATGLERGPSGFSRAVTVAWDTATGARKWVSSWVSPWAHGDLGYQIASATGRFYVATSSGHYSATESRGVDIGVIAYNAANGQQVWSTTWDSVGDVGNHSDDAWAVAVSPDGRHVVVGGRHAATGVRNEWGLAIGYHFATLSFAAGNGALEWFGSYTGGAGKYDEVNDIAFTPDSSTVVVTGDSYGGSGYQRATVAYNLATGVRKWATRYVGPGLNSDFGSAVAVSRDGRTAYVTGESVGLRTADVSTQALSVADGSVVWEARYTSNTLGGSHASDIVESPDGSRVYVAGASLGVASGWNFLTLAYDTATALPVWVARYTATVASIGSTMQDLDTEIALAPDGRRVFVNGTSDSGGSTDWDGVTVAYDA